MSVAEKTGGSGVRSSRIGTLLTACAGLAIATGRALIAAPVTVVTLLLGPAQGAVAATLGRIAGLAMLALGLACWPDRSAPAASRATLRALLTYNTLIALFLAWLGGGAHLDGILLWPAAALHGAIAVALAWSMSPSRHEA